MSKKVELLAPAGGYETMVGAFNAGADAVYLGGTRFGARAYADNFDTQQVLDAISYAHLHDKKIYMTVNTLVKEREFGELYDFMLPYAEKKLDGVIVQDYGVMRFIRDEFPEIELHASTQQTITGVHGARLLKELGCCRVVPARELSLMEMKAIRQEADIEVEAFIHGAMCYCYSGACLFSSMVGERSGNRGRCAQPCRLPYSLAGKGGNPSVGEVYPLSLKDMCTINMVPELIEAGIDSFKIEGRMKRPEYAAGVTSLYRKYIDMYYENPKKGISVSKEDMEMLRSLYLRTGISEGYYHKHNGKDMVTVSSPAYSGTSDEVLKNVHDKYLTGEMKILCSLFCRLAINEPVELTMTVSKDGDLIAETVTGNVVQGALKRPMDEEGVRKQLDRLGNTPFEADSIEISIDAGDSEGIFVPASELNELRRQLCEVMEARLLENGSEDNEGNNEGAENVSNTVSSAIDQKYKSVDLVNDTKNGGLLDEDFDHKYGTNHTSDFYVLVNTMPQLKAVSEVAAQSTEITGIYVDSDLFLTMNDGDADIFRNLKSERDDSLRIIIVLPFVTRKEQGFDACQDLDKISQKLTDMKLDGVLVRNFEQLGYLREKKFAGDVFCDYGIYNWNSDAACLLRECSEGSFDIKELSVPYELTIHEAKELSSGIRRKCDAALSLNVYGRTPMMISAGCVQKTLNGCSGKMYEFNTGSLSMIDRMGNRLPVTTRCRNCYNIIWNAHPTSLYKKVSGLKGSGDFEHLRIDFTTENEKETMTVLKAYIQNEEDAVSELLKMNTTTGHYKRGVE